MKQRERVDGQKIDKARARWNPNERGLNTDTLLSFLHFSPFTTLASYTTLLLLALVRPSAALASLPLARATSGRPHRRTSIPTTSLKHFTSIARRLYRIFAHAWYHHRDVFSACESETSLYERFLALSTEYDLVSPDLLVIPGQQGDGEGGSSSSSSDSSEDEQRDHDEEEVEDANPDELEHKLHEEEEEEEGEHAADVEQEAGVEHPSAESTQKGEGKEEDEEGRKDAEEEGEGASDHAAPDAPSAGEATEDAEEGKKVEASESQTSTSAAKALDVNEALVE